MNTYHFQLCSSSKQLFHTYWQRVTNFLEIKKRPLPLVQSALISLMNNWPNFGLWNRHAACHISIGMNNSHNTTHAKYVRTEDAQLAIVVDTNMQLHTITSRPELR